MVEESNKAKYYLSVLRSEEGRYAVGGYWAINPNKDYSSWEDLTLVSSFPAAIKHLCEYAEIKPKFAKINIGESLSFEERQAISKLEHLVRTMRGDEMVVTEPKGVLVFKER